MKHLFAYIILFLLFSFSARAQNVEYGAMVDTNYMVIGDQQNLRLKVKSQGAIRVDFPLLKDTVSMGVEIIKGPFRDSTKLEDGGWLYEERYVITAFDSGVYTIPSLPIKVAGDGYDNVIHTEPLQFAVNTFEIDESKGSYDIFMPLKTPLNFKEILPYLLWGLLAVAILALIGWIVWRYRKNKPLFVKEEPTIPPYEQAKQQLDELKQERLWQAGHEKVYYTKLTEVLRAYIEGELTIHALEMTSIEIIAALKEQADVSSANREALARLLETADYVKFAQMRPLQDENSHYLDIAYTFVEQTNEKVAARRAEAAQRVAEEEAILEQEENQGNI